MAKRSSGSFEHRKNDFYPTPIKAVEPLIRHLPKKFTFAEPCAGDGRLVSHIEKLSGGQCVSMTDIEPQESLSDLAGWRFTKADALDMQYRHMDFIITNPPWSRWLLHPMIEHFCNQRPTWLLFDADWMHTKQAIPYMPWCEKIVTVGRVKWIEDSPHSGKDNSCWYFFDKKNTEKTVFYSK
jgi:hypothetical protein